MKAESSLLTPGEVASLFGVNAKTVARWARRGFLSGVVVTLGGHRRFRRDEIMRLLDNPKPADSASV